ncbi:MAG: WhiB family transcriptional regulator [Candidatus Saccharibacteria bacterium]|nr:WhiB family transcriptional regulator [Candidatus Saccharibacteria bacterium]
MNLPDSSLFGGGLTPATGLHELSVQVGESAAAFDWRARTYYPFSNDIAYQTAELLDGASIYDLAPEAMPVVATSAVGWCLDAAKKPAMMIGRELYEHPARDAADVIQFVTEGAIRHVQTLWHDPTTISGPIELQHRLVARSSARLATALTLTVLDEVVDDLPTVKPPKLANKLSAIGNLHAHLCEIAEGARPDVDQVTDDLNCLRLSTANGFSPEDRGRYEVYVGLLEPVIDMTSRVRDDRWRSFDFLTTTADFSRAATDRLFGFVHRLDEDESAQILRDPCLTSQAAGHICEQAIGDMSCLFLDSVPEIDSIINTGRIDYRITAAEAQHERALYEVPPNTDEYVSKSEVLHAYLPEVRKIGIMKGGLFAYHHEAAVVAATLLDSYYQASTTDRTVFPDFNDMMIEIARQTGLLVATEQGAAVAELSRAQRAATLDGLHKLYAAQVERQSTLQANCFGADTAVFFTKRGASQKVANHICEACPEDKYADCFEQGLSVKFGVWAGQSEKARRRIRKQRQLPEPELQDFTSILQPASVANDFELVALPLEADDGAYDLDQLDDQFKGYLDQFTGKAV